MTSWQNSGSPSSEPSESPPPQAVTTAARASCQVCRVIASGQDRLESAADVGRDWRNSQSVRHDLPQLLEEVLDEDDRLTVAAQRRGTCKPPHEEPLIVWRNVVEVATAG